MFKDLPRAVWPLYGITFIDMLGLTILIPLLPFFVKRFGAPPQSVGLLLTTTAVVAMITGPIWGAVSDRIGRRWVLFCSQAFAFIGFILLGLSGSLLIAYISRVVQGLAGGNLGVADSYIADVTTEEQRPKAYAFSAAVFGAGFIVGPVVSGLLVHFGFVVPFLVAAAFEIANMTLTLKFLPDVRSAQQRKAKPSAQERHALLSALRDPHIISLLLRYFCFIFAFTYFFTAFSLYLDRMLNASASTSSFLLAIAGGIGAGVTILAVGRLSRRFGEWMVSEAAFLVALASFCLLFFVRDLFTFCLMLVLWAASGAALRPTLDALLSDAAPESQRGTIMGIGDSMNALAMIVSPPLGSWVVGADPAWTGLAPALTAILGFGVGLVWRDRGRRPQPAPN